MAALPENWEFDYDGSRWLYRYKPTGLVQYHFPKPGDEFPEFFDAFAPLDLAPEEKLESQQQLKRRSTTTGQSSNKQKQGGETSATIAEADDLGSGGGYWFQPDSYMFLGPGSYNDANLLREDDNAAETGAKKQTDPIDNDGKTAGKAKEEDATTASPGLKNKTVSPLTSAGTTPQTVSSKTANATPVLDEVVVGSRHDSIDAASVVDAGYVVSPSVPMLDSRPIAPNPLGVVPELASEMTAQCMEETHPPPVELPDQVYHTEVEPIDPSAYTGVFDIVPVELPAPHSPVEKTKQSALDDQKVLRRPDIDQHNIERPRREIAAALSKEAPLAQLPDTRSSQDPRPQPMRSKTDDTEGMPGAGKYQPYNPGVRRNLTEEHSRRSSLISSGQFSVVEHQDRELGVGGKRHSISGGVATNFDISGVPTALQPSRLQTKQTNDGAPEGNARGMSHVPSVLKPARGRPLQTPTTVNPNAAVSPPHIQPWKPAKASYMAYSPSQLRHSDSWTSPSPQWKSINPGVKEDQNGSGSSHPAAASREPERGISRTSTLPVDMPSLPFMGTREITKVPAHHTTHSPQVSTDRAKKPSPSNDSEAGFSPKPLALRPNKANIGPDERKGSKALEIGEQEPQLTANFANVDAMTKRPEVPKIDNGNALKMSEESPKYLVHGVGAIEQLPGPEVLSEHTKSPKVSPRVKSTSTSFSIAPEKVPVASSELLATHAELETQSFGRSKMIPGQGKDRIAQTSAHELPETDTSKLGMKDKMGKPLSSPPLQEDFTPMVGEPGAPPQQQHPHGSNSLWPQQTTQPPGQYQSATGSPPVGVDPAVMASTRTARPGDQGSSIPTRSQSIPAFVQGTGLPASSHPVQANSRSTAEASQMSENNHQQSLDGSASGLPPSHRSSLSGATPGCHNQSPPLGNSLHQSPLLRRDPAAAFKPASSGPENPQEGLNGKNSSVAHARPPNPTPDAIPKPLNIQRPPSVALGNPPPLAQAFAGTSQIQTTHSTQHHVQTQPGFSRMPVNQSQTPLGQMHSGQRTFSPGAIVSGPAYQNLLTQAPPHNVASIPQHTAASAQSPLGPPSIPVPQTGQTIGTAPPVAVDPSLLSHGTISTQTQQSIPSQQRTSLITGLPKLSQAPTNLPSVTNPRSPETTVPLIFAPNLSQTRLSQIQGAHVLSFNNAYGPYPSNDQLGKPQAQMKASNIGLIQTVPFLEQRPHQFQHSLHTPSQIHLQQSNLQPHGFKQPSSDSHATRPPLAPNLQGLGIQQPMAPCTQQLHPHFDGSSVSTQNLSEPPQVTAQLYPQNQPWKQQQQQTSIQSQAIPGQSAYASGVTYSHTKPLKVNTSQPQMQPMPSNLIQTPVATPVTQTHAGKSGRILAHQQPGPANYQHGIPHKHGAPQQSATKDYPGAILPPSAVSYTHLPLQPAPFHPGVTQTPPYASHRQEQQQTPPHLSSGIIQSSGVQPEATPLTPQSATPGKGKKDWFSKMVKSDTFKKTSFAIGGAILAESMGSNAASGAIIGGSIFDTTSKNKLQKPPPTTQPAAHHFTQAHPQGSQTAPPMVQGLPPPSEQHFNNPAVPGISQPAAQYQLPFPPSQPAHPTTMPVPQQSYAGHPPPRPPMVTSNSAPAVGQPPQDVALPTAMVDIMVQAVAQSASNGDQQQGQQAQNPSASQHHHYQRSDNQQLPSEQGTTVVYSTEVNEVNVNLGSSVDITETMSVVNVVTEDSILTGMDSSDAVSISDTGDGGWGTGGGYDGSGWGDEDDEFAY